MQRQWKKFLNTTALLLAGLTAAAWGASAKNPPATASRVDLNRYIGRWYEIARLPTPFQRASEPALAEYGRNPDGTVSVRNVAVRPDGTQREIRGTAKVLNPPQNTKLAVRFNTWFGPFIPIPKEGNYWVLYIDPTYRHALVGTPSRKYLWILARDPKIPEESYRELVGKAKALGFDTPRIIRDPR